MVHSVPLVNAQRNNCPPFDPIPQKKWSFPVRIRLWSPDSAIFVLFAAAVAIAAAPLGTFA